MDDAIAPFRPRRLAVASVAIIAFATAGSIVLAWPLPASPELSIVHANSATAMARADAYAAALVASPRAAMFDPEGHARLIEERERAASPPRRPPDATSAFRVLEAAGRHADATVFPRWTAVFSFALCLAGGVMGLWRARRAIRADEPERGGRMVNGADPARGGWMDHADPGPAVNREAVGLAVAAALVSAFLVGWTSKLTSTLVTLFTSGSSAALMIAGRVMPPSLIGLHFRPGRAARIMIGAALTAAGVLARRTLAPAADAGAVEIVVRSLPTLLCSSVMVYGTLLSTGNLAYLLMRRSAS